MNTNQKHNDHATEQSAQFKFESSLVSGGLCVVGFSNPEGLTKIVVPEQVDNLKVVQLCDGCFEDHEEIMEVVLPKTIQHIPQDCFCGCVNLSGVEMIDPYAFCGCDNLHATNQVKTVL